MRIPLSSERAALLLVREGLEGYLLCRNSRRTTFYQPAYSTTPPESAADYPLLPLLSIEVVPRSWGPQKLRVRLRLEGGTSGNTWDLDGAQSIIGIDERENVIVVTTGRYVLGIKKATVTAATE